MGNFRPPTHPLLSTWLLNDPLWEKHLHLAKLRISSFTHDQKTFVHNQRIMKQSTVPTLILLFWQKMSLFTINWISGSSSKYPVLVVLQLCIRRISDRKPCIYFTLYSITWLQLCSRKIEQTILLNRCVMEMPTSWVFLGGDAQPASWAGARMP